MTAAGGGPVIRLTALTKRYEGRAVVDRLDLEVERGEILALLGPNGAGKTTTVEMVEGYRRPDDGTASVLGLDPIRERGSLMPRVGLMLQSGGLYSQLHPIEAVRLFAAFYTDPMDPASLLERVGLGRVAKSRYRSLSGGERQRLSLALAVVGRPELAVLDEPTAAMDAQARRATWDMLRELRQSGTTILLTTHFLDEAEALADRVAILDRGRLVALDTPAGLRRSARSDGSTGRQVRLELEAPLEGPGLSSLAALPGVDGLVAEGAGRYALDTAAPGPLLVELSRWLLDEGIEPLAIRLGHATLEEVFLQLTSEAPGDGDVAAETARREGAGDGGGR